MTISLPYLWIAGHLAAPVGLCLALYHLVTRGRLVGAWCVLGGLLSCALLAAILVAIEKSFFGVYQWLAWVVAFFAGYAVSAPAVYAVRIAQTHWSRTAKRPRSRNVE